MVLHDRDLAKAGRSSKDELSLVPRLHPVREERSGAPSPNSWIVPQNEEHPIRSLKDYVITF